MIASQTPPTIESVNSGHDWPPGRVPERTRDRPDAAPRAGAEPGGPALPAVDARTADAFTQHWPFGALLVLALLVPALLFGAVAWNERAALLREGELTARRTAGAMTEHALKVLETHALVLEQVDMLLRDRGWDDIADDTRLQQHLADTASRLPQISGIWLVDALGRQRQGSHRAGNGLSAVDREYFTAHRDGVPNGRLHVGMSFEGRVFGKRLFSLSLRRTTPDGRFDGVIVAAVPIDYFTQFWKQLAPSAGYIVPLVRRDGAVLVRYPAGGPDRLPSNGPFMEQLAKAPAGFYAARSHVDGIERLNAFSRIGDHPLFVSFSLEVPAVLAQWSSRVRIYAALALVVALALAGLVLIAMRQARAQHRVALRWQDAARRAEIEMQGRKQAEAELVQAQKMEAVGQLTGGVAHDFNNLLHALGLNLRLAERVVGPQAPAATYLENARRGVERAAQLTRQLTAFSRRQRLEPCDFAPTDLVVRMGDLLVRTLGGKVELQVAMEGDPWPIHADPGQTELALLNLAVNARDAMPSGGRLTITARNRTLPSGQRRLGAGDYVELAVTDTGTGMPADVIGRAFEPLFTTKEVGKGSGLGLSMVHGFATQSGGGVWIESRLGQGTTVRLLLPRGEALPARAARHAAGADSPGSKPPPRRLCGRVLLAEDDSLVRTSMRLTLVEAGYTVEEAGSGPEALEALRRGPVDLLVTDYAMPGMTGIDLAQLARALQPELPIVLVTGYAQPALDARAEQRVDAVLHKPFAPHELLARIESLSTSGMAA